MMSLGSVLVILCLAFPSFANLLPGEDLAKDFQAARQEIEKQEIKQRQVLSALYQINKKIKKNVLEKGDLLKELALVEESIRQLTEKVDELEAKSSKQKILLSQRMRALYQAGGPTVARFFMSMDNSAQMERNLKIMGIVAQHDLQLIKEHAQDVRELQSRQKKLAGRKQHLQKLHAKIDLQEQKFVHEQKTKNRILDGVRKNRMFSLSKIQDLRQKSLHTQIEDAGVLDMLFKPSFADQKGHLPKPTDGFVSRDFGFEKSSHHSYTLNHKGVFISAKQDQDIKTIFEGIVSFAGDLPGFGKTLIIDHGDHYYTVYSHAKEIKVQMGEEVSSSQVIAKVGHSTREKKDGLYFEIRHFSEPYDPQQWMKGLN